MEHLCYALSLLVYFPTKLKGCCALDLIKEAFYHEENICTRWKERNFIPNLNVLMNLSKDLLKDVYLVDVVDDNYHSGVVFYIFYYQNSYIYVYRGSENSDILYQTTGWQDWSDNLLLCLNEETPQQLYAKESFIHHPPVYDFYLCGHSKGGNLAIYTALSMDTSYQSHLRGVYTYNAVGLQKEVLLKYRDTFPQEAFSKFNLFESEHDCISSCFEHVCQPYIVKSSSSCWRLMDLYDHHNMYGIQNMLEDDYVLVAEKSVGPQLVHYLVNEYYMNRSEEQRREFVMWMNDMFEQNITMQELVIKVLKKFFRIQPKALANIDLSQLSWRQLLKNLQDLRKKEVQNEENHRVES